MATVAGLERQVAGALRRAGFSGNGTTLVVGVSGGPDSTALLHCLHRLREQHQLSLHVAHLDHNFRGEEAHEDARFAAALAQELNLSSTVEERDALGYQRQRGISSFEQAAREIRYAFLAEVAGQVDATAVAVGHTSDDLAETVLLHILRGSGSRGLRAMSELSSWPWPQSDPGLKLFRPLLQSTKDDTLGYCRELDKRYREDSGNYLSRFARNQVRLNLLPQLASEYNPRVKDSLVRLSRTAALELDYLEGEVTRLWEQAAAETQNSVTFHQPDLTSLHPAILNLLLRRAYTHLRGNSLRLGQRHLDAMAGLVRSMGGVRSLDLPGGLKFHCSYRQVWLTYEEGIPSPFPDPSSFSDPSPFSDPSRFSDMEEAYSLAIPSAREGSTSATVGPWRINFNIIDSLPQQHRHRGPSGAAAAETLPLPLAWTAYFHRDSLGDRVQIRTRRAGDRFRPLGLGGEKKLQDFFTDAKVPKPWRDRVPLMVTPRGIAWVVGYRIADWAKAPEPEPEPTVGNKGLKEVLEVTFEVQS